MKRSTAIVLGVAVSVLCAVALVGLSMALSVDRRTDREAYQDALLQQRRTAGLLLRAQPKSSEPTPRDKQFCVRGVDTFISVLHRSLGSSVLDEKGRLEPNVMSELSNLATRAERYVEHATAAPALPQRMGRERGNDGQWQPLHPELVACESGEAFAAFRLLLPAEEPTSDEPGQGEPKPESIGAPRRL